MALLDHLYFNFFTIGAFIPFVFGAYLGISFLLIKNKSRATLHVGLLLVMISIFYFGYFISSTLYHPLAAYHRWITAGIILPGLAHMTLFFFYFPDEKYHARAKKLLFVLYAVSAVILLTFIIISLNSAKIFHFDGHYWDFDAEKISSFLAMMIILYIIIFIITGFWRFFTTKTKERWAVLFILSGFMISSIVPAILNILSRTGIIGRGTYQISLDIFLLVGFFIISILYINNSKDRTTFLSKIISVSLLTFLLILQGFGYFSIMNLEKVYDLLSRKDLSVIINGDTLPENLEYIFEYKPGNDELVINYNKYGSEVNWNDADVKAEMAGTKILTLISGLSADNFDKEIDNITSHTPHYFKGYRSMITSYAEETRGRTDRAASLIARLLKQSDQIGLWRKKINAMPQTDFRRSLSDFMKAESGNRSMIFFNDAISDYLKMNFNDDMELKTNVLRSLAPLNMEGFRLYRNDTSLLRHAVSFMKTDPVTGNIFEAGFNYTSYRLFLHRISMIYILLSMAAIAIILIGYQFFFKGAIINPLNRLLSSMQDVRRGDLETRVRITIEDEIGFLSRQFNEMVSTIQVAKGRLDHYAEDLSRQVDERTEKLLIAINDMEAAKAQTDNILKNVQEGLFILNSDFNINEQYSSMLNHIFETDDLSGKSLMDLLSEMLEEKDYIVSRDYLEIVRDGRIPEKRLRKLNPLYDVKVVIRREDQIIEKYLRFSFARIVDGNKNPMILATVHDSTEEIRLGHKVKETEIRSQDEIKLLFGIIHLNPLVLRKFFSESRSEIQLIEKELEEARFSGNLKFLLNGILRMVHSIKGDAAQLGLDMFTEHAHIFEEKMTVLMQKNDLAAFDLISLPYAIVEMKEELMKIEKLINKISSIKAAFGNDPLSEQAMLYNTINDLVSRVAKREGKNVRIDFSELNIPEISSLDIRSLKKIIIQITKNAVNHGIETPEERKISGKPMTGTITFKSFSNNKQFSVVIRDDGRGLQLDKICKTAVESGRYTEEELLKIPKDKIANLIFEPGLSTTHEVTIDAGRGVGLDVVKHEIHKMGGRLHLKYSPGNYTEFIISLPVLPG